jgi:hypothetical protein
MTNEECTLRWIPWQIYELTVCSNSEPTKNISSPWQFRYIRFAATMDLRPFADKPSEFSENAKKCVLPLRDSAYILKGNTKLHTVIASSLQGRGVTIGNCDVL